MTQQAETILLDGVSSPFVVDWVALTSGDEAAAHGFISCSVAYASAHRAHVNAVAAFRNWRADALSKLIKEDAKAGEWKARAVVEAQPGYLQHKARLANIEQALLVLRAACAVLALAIGADPSTPILIADDA